MDMVIGIPGLEINKISTALVVIDLQVGILSMPTFPYNANTVTENAVRLAEAFRKNSMPVFLVHVKASEAEMLKPVADERMSFTGERPNNWADFVAALGPKENDIVITKKQWGAFYGTELDMQLRRRGISTIVLCGIATNYGVESTARFTYEYGYQQIFAEDATAARSEEEHMNTITHVFKRIGRVRKTDEILKGLDEVVV